jgi:phage tail sheath protein FI
VYSGLALDRNHQINGESDSIEAQFSPAPDTLSAARTIPIVITMQNADDGLALLESLLASQAGLESALLDPLSTDVDRSIDIVLAGGNDGERPPGPGETGYEGAADPNSTTKTGLKAFEDIDEISIVAAPGSTFGYSGGYRDDANTIIGLLIAHAELMRYRIAVLDSGDGESVADVRALRGQFDSTYAALYYPWVTILDPVTRKEINLPPSGFVTGIYARNDINRAVYKAPANEVVTLALTFETVLNKAQQDILNPLGVNCFRFFEDRGYRLWGARTISSDPEWKYVNMRRYFAYLEHSLDKGTQWAVFEPNGELLWASLKRTVSDFLLNEFQNGALLGDKPEQAYFVRCDRTTMTQNDLDNGRVIVLVGVAALTPAEFVIFRIGQWTASS